MKKIIFLVLVVVCADVWAMKLEIRPGYNKEASEALFQAARFYPAVERVKRAIAAGADVNVKDDSGYTPLHLVGKNNETEAMEALIAAGADVNAKTNYGKTPLHLAVIINNKTEAIKALIAVGADVNTKDNDDHTPLFSAVYKNSKELTDVLIKARASVIDENKSNITLLHMAAMNNATKVMSSLIAAGIDVNAKDDDDHTPLYFAVKQNQTEAMKALIELGATIPDRLYPYQIKALDSVIKEVNKERESYNDALRGFSALRGKAGRMQPLMFERLYAPRLPLASEVYAQRQAAEAI